MVRHYRSWHRAYGNKKFMSSTPIRSRLNKLYRFLKRNELIRVWKGKSRGKYNY